MGRKLQDLFFMQLFTSFSSYYPPLHLSPVDFHQGEKQTLAVSITQLKAFICNTEGVRVIRDMWKYWDINSCRLDLNRCNKNPSCHFAVFTSSYFSIRKKNHKVDLFNTSVVSPRQQWDKMQTFEAPSLSSQKISVFLSHRASANF